MKNKHNYSTVVWVLFLTFLISCKPDDDGDNSTLTTYPLNYGAFPAPTIPEDNPLTKEGVELGRMLFYETALSKDNSMSCSTCHAQANAFSDTNTFSTGVEGLQGGRQAMAIFNMLWNTNEFFWDGRAHLLRDQSIMPIQDPLEMNETMPNVIQKLKNKLDYTSRFETVFDEEINEVTISLALEQFMNSIVSNQSKYDRFKAGVDQLNDAEERGRALFFEEFNPFFPENSGADCAHCHGGLNFENDDYMNNGITAAGNFSSDTGREKATGNSADRGKFKVTSLRNIELTPPYMHDGRFKTLEEVVNHYNEGLNSSPTLNLALKDVYDKGGLALSDQDKADLVSFLKTLTDNKLTTNPAYSNPF
ncbi:MAG: cytochrome-c peroxidase [Flavobacteriales bacterium]